MNKCPVCGAAITSSNPFVLFHSDALGEDVAVCDRCGMHAAALQKGGNAIAIKRAIRYFQGRASGIKNRSVKKYVKRMIEDVPATALIPKGLREAVSGPRAAAVRRDAGRAVGEILARRAVAVRRAILALRALFAALLVLTAVFGVRAVLAVSSPEYREAAKSYYWKAMSYNAWADAYNEAVSFGRSMEESFGMGGVTYSDLRQPINEMAQLKAEMEPLEEIVLPALAAKRRNQALATGFGVAAGVCLLLSVGLAALRVRFAPAAGGARKRAGAKRAARARPGERRPKAERPRGA